MAITINYLTNEILVPKADTLFVEISAITGLEIRQLNINTFGKALADIQDNSEDVVGSTAYSYTQPADVGGVTLAPVLLILDPYTVTFEDGQYAVNFVGGNTNLQDFTNVNQVSIRPNNSAGQTFSKQSEDTAYADSRVWIDTISGLPGTGYPRGTVGDPVNNLADAQAIIVARRLPKRIHLQGSITTIASDDISKYDITGSSSRLSFLNITTGTNTEDLIISSISVMGDLNGNVTATNATSFDNIIDFDGRMILCGLSGTIDLGTPAEIHDFIDCYSEQPGNSKPILDCDNLSSSNVQFRRYSGGLEIRNFVNGGSNMSLDINQGSILLDSSCTGGTIVIRGDADVVDNSGVGCTVINRTSSENVWNKEICV